MSQNRGAIRSAVVIARLLDTEGFTEHTASEITRYYLNGLSRRKLSQFMRMKKEISEMCKKFSEGEKQVLGKFINTHKNISFDCGLKIGLTAYAVPLDKSVEKGENE